MHLLKKAGVIALTGIMLTISAIQPISEWSNNLKAVAQTSGTLLSYVKVDGVSQDVAIQLVIRNQITFIKLADADQWFKTKTIADATGKRTTTRGTVKVTWSRGSSTVSKNGNPIALAAAPVLLNGVYYLPAKTFAQLFGIRLTVDLLSKDEGVLSIQNPAVGTAGASAAKLSQSDFVIKSGTLRIELLQNMATVISKLISSNTNSSKELPAVDGSTSEQSGIAYMEYRFGKSNAPTTTVKTAQNLDSGRTLLAEWRCKTCSSSRGIKPGGTVTAALTKYGKPLITNKSGNTKEYVYRSGNFTFTIVQANAAVDRVTELVWRTPLLDRIASGDVVEEAVSDSWWYSDGQVPTATAAPTKKPQYFVQPVITEAPTSIPTATPSASPVVTSTPTSIPTATPLPTPSPTPVFDLNAAEWAIPIKKATPIPLDYVQIYYKKSSSNTFMHYRPAGGSWTREPGVAMRDSFETGYVELRIPLNSANGIAEAAFSDGNGKWDNNGGNGVNYSFSPGTWTVTDRMITEGTPVERIGQTTGSAPGAPGANGKWSNGAKQFIGTPANAYAQVAFTGADGILTEVFYPSPDMAQSVDTRLMIASKNGSWIDDEKDQVHTVKMVHKKALAWEVTTTDRDNRYRIIKTFFADPRQQSMVERVQFEALTGTVADYDLYVVHDPAVRNGGGNDSGTVATSFGRSYLIAKQERFATAVSVSSKLAEGTLSNGYAGSSSDPRSILNNRKNLSNAYSLASNGNIVQAAKVEMPADGRFDLVIGFGANAQEAMAEADGTFRSDLDQKLALYLAEWKAYCDKLNHWNQTADDIYYLSAMTLKASQDKDNGAIVAALGTPWGENIPDSGNFTYHLIWARDLYKFAMAMATAGDTRSANAALDYLFTVQMDQNTGRFPQNSRVDGTPEWSNTQMDEQGMPIMLAWQLQRYDLWPYVQKTADYLAANGPYTPQERWEESGGYSPSTLAAEIAGLVCAADIADRNGDFARSSRYLALADQWQRNIENWTFTTNGPLGNGRYFVRVDPTGKPNEYKTFELANQGGKVDPRTIMDMGFLELVRYGVKSANDPAILDSLPETDQALKQTIQGKGDAWFRYTNDRYGESLDGKGWNFTPGKGRLWPFLTAERGMYEIIRSGNASSGVPYLNALRAFADPNGFLPEQVWDLNAPSGRQPGTATGSVQPLNWTMGEYIQLFASVQSGKAVGIPEIVKNRYADRN